MVMDSLTWQDSDRPFYKLKFNFWLIYRYPFKIILCVNILHYGPYKMNDSDYHNKHMVEFTMGGGRKLTVSTAEGKNL